MRRIYLLFTLFLSGTGFLWSQSISGRITDQQKNPLEAVQVASYRTLTHTHTDPSGRFTLMDVQPGDTLDITQIGYERKKVVVTDLSEELMIQITAKGIELSEVLVTADMDAINLFSKVDLQTQPVNSSQEILRKVPGLVIGQHAGGGKAEQIFLRGFDIDHGTDINLTVDGIPVNMVSHAHGQGYADLHFLIPETIEQLNFGKGPYYANQGNFATAGYVDFRTKEQPENSLVKLEAGQFNTQRYLGIFNLLGNQPNHAAYVASEYQRSNGPFESSQNFSRLNLMAKYTGYTESLDRFSVMGSWFSSSWDASGQVPTRAVEAGDITRFGAIDDTEGGITRRGNFSVDYTKNLSSQAYLKNKVFYSYYDFELFSNFTFFLEDTVNGDQIRQFEQRQLFGANTEYNQSFTLGSGEGKFQAGAGFRSDRSNENELSHTVNRTDVLEYYALGDIQETNLYGYGNLALEFGPWSINPGVRIDQFTFNYQDRLTPAYNPETVTKSIISPKLNFLYSPSPTLQLYLKTGKGFHSNDTRVVVARQGQQILPGAYGADLGGIWKPTPQLLLNVAAWYLYLEQEFVYVGDAAIVEPSGATERKGIDVSARYQPLSWLYLNADATYTIARSVEGESGEQFIPLAPDLTVNGGLSVIHPSGIYGGLRVRYLDDRPANEDNSIVAEGYTVVDLNTGYKWKMLDVGVTIQNLLNTEWNETQFATESRLVNELEPVEEIHFTPGTPFFLKTTLAISF